MQMRARPYATVVIVLAVMMPSTPLRGWGVQGHRLVALIAARHLSPVARENVAWLLEKQTLADVAIWADGLVGDQQQTGWWHYVNIPPDAKGYDRDRDCPRQPGVASGARGDRWRDCIVDRIGYFEARLADRALDRADRAIALKFLVHFVGDLHQPFHALGVGRGGNDVLVRLFGAANCGNDPAKPVPCNLHSVWDSRLISHRGLDDDGYLEALATVVSRHDGLKTAPGAPADWAMESWTLSKAALVAPNANIDEAYYKTHLGAIDSRLAQAGLRLAAVLNRALNVPR